MTCVTCDLCRPAEHRGDWLGLVRVSRHHAGAYHCIANNEVPPAISKRIMVNVACELDTPDARDAAT